MSRHIQPYLCLLFLFGLDASAAVAGGTSAVDNSGPQPEVVVGTGPRFTIPKGASTILRVEEGAFATDAGLITFSEFAINTNNPVYMPGDYGGDMDAPVVTFAGFFAGQMLGDSNSCPTGAVTTGCVIGNPSSPLMLDGSSPATFITSDSSNPTSPVLSGSPEFNGPIAIAFDRDVAGVGLEGGFFDSVGSTAITAYARDGSILGQVSNEQTGIEFLGLVMLDGSPQIAGLLFSLVGAESFGFAIDNLRFGQAGEVFSPEGRIDDVVPSPGDLATGDQFGTSVAASGNLMVVGMPMDDNANGADAGRVIVYRVEGNGLVMDQEIPIPPGFTARHFGASVSVFGDFLVVGAPGEPPAAKGAGVSALQAAIFQRLSGGWSLKQAMTGQGASGNDRFGSAVSLSGDSMVIGAPDDDEGEGAGNGSGAAYFFDFDGSNFVQRGKRKSDNATPGQGFGASVAAGRGKFAVGSPQGQMAATASGTVSVFQMIGTNLTGLGTVIGSQSSAGDRFGEAVSIDGDTVLVGSPGEDAGASDSGAVYTFDIGSGFVQQMGRATPSDPVAGGAFGSSVAASEDFHAIGASNASTPSGPAGAVYRFRANFSEQVQKLTALSGQAGFGKSVGLSRDRMIVGAPDSASLAGAAAFQLNPRDLFVSSFEGD